MKGLDPRLWRHARTVRWHVAAMGACGALSGGLLIAQAALLAHGIAALDPSVVLPLAAVIGARALLVWLGEWLAARAAIAVKSTLRRQVTARVLRLGPDRLSHDRSGATAALLTTGFDGLDSYVSRYLPALMVAAIVPLMTVVALARADLTSAVIVIVALPLIPVFMALVGAGAAAASRRRFAALATLSHHFMDVVSGLATLKAFGRARAQPERVRAISDDYRVATMGTLRLAFLSALVLDVLAMIAVALVAVDVGLRLVGGDLGFGTALFVLILAPEAFAPLRALGATFHASADGLAAMDAVEDVLTQPVPAAPSGSAPRGGALEISNLWVRRSERPHPTPAGFSLRAEPGEFIAITGASGVGKSTVFGVLLGFTPMDEGRIRVGDLNLAAVDPDAWRRQFSWLPQTPYLMAGDVRSNIALGCPDAPEARIAAAARDAALDVPLDAPVADGGVGLSAGQRRRVGLARALLRDAPILLLDEPTAGLDADTEARVVANLRAIERTVLVIAHRPAVIDAADRVVTIAAPDPATGPEADPAFRAADALVTEPVEVRA